MPFNLEAVKGRLNEWIATEQVRASCQFLYCFAGSFDELYAGCCSHFVQAHPTADGLPKELPACTASTQAGCLHRDTNGQAIFPEPLSLFLHVSV